MHSDLYDVTLIGFHENDFSGEPPAAALCRVFPIDRLVAMRLVSAVPVKVKHGVPAALARRYRQALEAIGAMVSVELTGVPQRPATPPTSNAGGSLRSTPPSPSPAPVLDGIGVVTRPSTPVPTPISRTRGSRPAPSRPTPSRPAPVSQQASTEFFSSIPQSLFLPLRGDGIGWLMGAFGVGVASALIGIIPVIGWFLQLFFLGGLVALCAKYFLVCMNTTRAEEKKPSGLPNLSNFKDEFGTPGSALTFWLLVTYLPLIGWGYYQSQVQDFFEYSLYADPVALILLVLPAFFWPMALAHQGATGSHMSMWNFPRIAAAVARAPLHYLTVLVAGALATVLPFIVMSTFSGLLAILAAILLSAVAMAYCHGVMGALMGHLTRNKPAVLPAD